MQDNDDIEHQLFKLLRRTNAIHVQTSSGEIELERSAYAILCLIADDGPQRLGSIATAFRLDPSTITRQLRTPALSSWTMPPSAAGKKTSHGTS